MALGKRTGKRREGIIAVADLPALPAPFYERLNVVLAEPLSRPARRIEAALPAGGERPPVGFSWGGCT